MRTQDLKNIYIYDAKPEDRIKFCGREIKRRGQAAPSKPINIEGIRVRFLTDFASAAALGIDQRLDIAAVNTEQYRGSRMDIQYLGIAGVYSLEIAEVN
ncbi:MAG: hypothetical protein JKY71_02755 [Alphaproteobacteria bacterium]|nr:hypothetical protein [Alphaproteobacteria bacterium]